MNFKKCMKKKGVQKEITECEKAYLSGFLDGDGCLLAQIVKGSDLKYGFRIRVSIIFYQKKKRH